MNAGSRIFDLFKFEMGFMWYRNNSTEQLSGEYSPPPHKSSVRRNYMTTSMITCHAKHNSPITCHERIVLNDVLWLLHNPLIFSHDTTLSTPRDRKEQNVNRLRHAKSAHLSAQGPRNAHERRYITMAITLIDAMRHSYIMVPGKGGSSRHQRVSA